MGVIDSLIQKLSRARIANDEALQTVDEHSVELQFDSYKEKAVATKLLLTCLPSHSTLPHEIDAEHDVSYAENGNNSLTITTPNAFPYHFLTNKLLELQTYFSYDHPVFEGDGTNYTLIQFNNELSANCAMDILTAMAAHYSVPHKDRWICTQDFSYVGENESYPSVVVDSKVFDAISSYEFTKSQQKSRNRA